MTEALLTADEVIERLRLDAVSKNPAEFLRNLRRRRELTFVKLHGVILYPREAVDRLLQAHTVEAAP